MNMSDLEADLMLVKARIVTLEAEIDASAQLIKELKEQSGVREETIARIGNRLMHLLESDFIKRYDEKLNTGEYVLDIRRLDDRMRYLEHLEEIDDAADDRNVDATQLLPLYICDRRKCSKCNPECRHTEDVRHAKSFEVSQDGEFIIEQED